MRPGDWLLATIPPDIVVDRYGDGGVVADLEAQVAGLLGKEAAVFLPSGMMAQGVLRVHAERRGRRTVLRHPLCHLEQHEGGRTSGCRGCSAGRSASRTGCSTPRTSSRWPSRPPRCCWSCRSATSAASPTWDDLAAQVAGRASAAPRRTWTAPGSGRRRPATRPPAEIAALFDTVYVSFYKGIGALAGLLRGRRGRATSRRCASGAGGWAAPSSASGRSPRPRFAARRTAGRMPARTRAHPGDRRGARRGDGVRVCRIRRRRR